MCPSEMQCLATQLKEEQIEELKLHFSTLMKTVQVGKISNVAKIPQSSSHHEG